MPPQAGLASPTGDRPQALYQHPAVYETCVVCVPDDTWGEAVKAVVVLRDGHRARVAEVPRNADGKLSRKMVRAPRRVARQTPRAAG